MSNHSNPIPSWLNESYMTAILQKSLKAPDLAVVEMKITPASAVGDNYCCQVLRIKMVLNIGGEVENLSIIGKVTPESKLLDSIKEKFDVFDIEASLFDSILPELKKYIKNLMYFAPECYHVDIKYKSIFMEDLKDSNYELQPRGKFLDRNQCRLVVETLATFHGASYYAIKADPTLPEKYKKTFWDGTVNEMMKKMFRNAQMAIEKNIDNYGLSEEYVKKLLKFEDSMYDGKIQIMRKQDDRLNFLLHGDDWMNNMMFHYEDGVPDAVKLLDFQIVHYNSFANDLHYFLFSSASADVLLSDLDWLLERYFTKLQEVAPDIPNLTLDRVKSEFAERYYFGYLLTISFRAFIVSETPPNMDNILSGKLEEMGFNHSGFISDLRRLLPLFDAAGVF